VLSLLGQTGRSVLAGAQRRSVRGATASAAIDGCPPELGQVLRHPREATVPRLRLHPAWTPRLRGQTALDRCPAEVRGETLVQDSLALGGCAAVGDEVATGLLNGPLDGGSGGVAAMLSECSPSVDAGSQPRKKIKTTPLQGKGWL
jgi:hypothetical protein